MQAPQQHRQLRDEAAAAERTGSCTRVSQLPLSGMASVVEARAGRLWLQAGRTAAARRPLRRCLPPLPAPPRLWRPLSSRSSRPSPSSPMSCSACSPTRPASDTELRAAAGGQRRCSPTHRPCAVLLLGCCVAAAAAGCSLFLSRRFQREQILLSPSCSLPFRRLLASACLSHAAAACPFPVSAAAAAHGRSRAADCSSACCQLLCLSTAVCFSAAAAVRHCPVSHAVHLPVQQSALLLPSASSASAASAPSCPSASAAVRTGGC